MELAIQAGEGKKTTKLPAIYEHFKRLFSEEASQRFPPVTKMGESIDGFEVDHGSLESLQESLEKLLTDHGFVYVILSHSDHMFEVCDVFVDITSFHFEGKDVPSCKVLAHVVLECFGKVVDNRGPDPFVCVSSPKGYVFGNQLTRVLYPCFDSGSLNISQK